MFILKKRFGAYTVDIQLTGSPVAIKKNEYFFGFPLNLDEVYRNSYLVEKFANELKGTWLRIHSKEDRMIISADLTGGFRLYKIQIGKRIYLSDDYEYILAKSGLPMEKESREYQYWEKHRYCTGGRTFIKGLEKLKPASVLNISEKGLQEENLFLDVREMPSAKLHVEEVHRDLKDTIACLNKYKGKSKVILFFSGGVDSTLLAKLMQAQKLPFQAVFLQPDPQPEANRKDFERAQIIADQLGMPLDFCVFKNQHEEIDPKEICQLQLFDRHFSSTFYYGTQAVIDKYGKDIIIVNGQSSDNIFSFGPTSGYFAYLQRYVMYREDNLAQMATKILSLLKKKQFRLPENELERELAYLDEFEGCYLLEENADAAQYDYLSTLIVEQFMGHYSLKARLMYWRLFTYLQGSDNQVVVNSAKYLGIKGVVMPFATPRIIYATIAHKHWKREVVKAKYCIEDILELYDFKYPKQFAWWSKLKRFTKLLRYNKVFPEDEKLGMEGVIFNYAREFLNSRQKDFETKADHVDEKVVNYH